ncbi:hypothetical protein [Staphylococcus devriesei]|uniref:hypothetical protein n=1 Tax=Staphylococcus devriesei TaxID=586733 RepID=UPI001F2F52B7|nr:hypothetical protein [Staphylococcus devriesei]MCE5089211.1 hypothetical protein [Staphylococcus devriesei]
MIKKAVERPKQVEYIEFKGMENYKEVAEFLEQRCDLITKMNGNELLSLRYKGKERTIITGAIIYRTYDYEFDQYNFEITGPEEFYRQYREVERVMK